MEELKEMVIKNLDSQGVLDAIRAQLRANVFQAILSQEGRPGVSVPASDAHRIMETERGQACAELLREFMGRSGLNQTLGVYTAETKLPAEQMDRRALESKLKLKGRPDQPLLLSLLDRLKDKQRQAEDASKFALSQPSKPAVQPLAKPIPERSFPEVQQRTGFDPSRPDESKSTSASTSLKPELKPLARAPALAPLDRKLETEEKKFEFESKKPGGALNLERKFAAAGLGRQAVFEDDDSGDALPDFSSKPAPKREEPVGLYGKKEDSSAKQAQAAAPARREEPPKPAQATNAPLGKREEPAKPAQLAALPIAKKEEPAKLAPLPRKEDPPKPANKKPDPPAKPAPKKEDPKPFFSSKSGPKVFELHSSGEEEVEEDIELPEDMDIEVQPAKGPLLESMGTSSLGVDASVDSLALEEYDHVEKVAKASK